MKKSVYSLVLMDDVVDAIDELAYRLGTSRSNLINQILAERVSYVTPERRMRDIFDCLRSMMDSHFQILGQASDAMLSLRSPLRFKYKPTIRYRVELLKEPIDNTFGYLTVSFRTQSEALMNAIGSFFRVWTMIESKYLKAAPETAVSEGKLVRALRFPEDNSISSDDERLGEAIGSYINITDTCIKLFFADIEHLDSAVGKAESFYRDNLARILV